MVQIDASSVIGMDVVTGDAYVVGSVQDIRYNVNWGIEGLKVRCNKKVSNILGAGTSKTMILLGPAELIMNDVILLPESAEEAKCYVRADTDIFSSLSYLDGRKVVSSDSVLIGTIDSILIDLDVWCVISIKIKVDKNACELLGLKKGLFAKTVSGILTSNIESVTENVLLNVNVDQIKNMISLD